MIKSNKGINVHDHSNNKTPTKNSSKDGCACVLYGALCLVSTLITLLLLICNYNN